jgi:hypothetical protein
VKKAAAGFGASNGSSGRVFIGDELGMRHKESSNQIILILIPLTEDLWLVQQGGSRFSYDSNADPGLSPGQARVSEVQGRHEHMHILLSGQGVVVPAQPASPGSAAVRRGSWVKPGWGIRVTGMWWHGLLTGQS